jgi:hypothetical protein
MQRLVGRRTRAARSNSHVPGFHSLLYFDGVKRILYRMNLDPAWQIPLALP